MKVVAQHPTIDLAPELPLGIDMDEHQLRLRLTARGLPDDIRLDMPLLAEVGKEALVRWLKAIEVEGRREIGIDQLEKIAEKLLEERLEELVVLCGEPAYVVNSSRGPRSRLSRPRLDNINRSVMVALSKGGARHV